MKNIPLSQGKVAIVDDKDFGKLSKHKWFFLEDKKGTAVGYSARNIKVGKKRTLELPDLLDTRHK